MNQTDVAPAPPPGPAAAARSSEWTAGRIAALVIAVLLGLLGLTLVGGGGTALWAHLTQRDGDYVTTDVHNFSTTGSALATERTHLGGAGVGWLYSPGLLGKLRVRVTPASSRAPLFVGIARSNDVDRYLSGVNHTVITDFFGDKVEPAGGAAIRSLPGAQRFWVASSTGPGARTVVWKPKGGSWTVLVMNADGRAGVDIGADVGARMPALPWIALGLLLGGAVLLAGGVLLGVGAVRRRTG